MTKLENTRSDAGDIRILVQCGDDVSADIRRSRLALIRAEDIQRRRVRDKKTGGERKDVRSNPLVGTVRAHAVEIHYPVRSARQHRRAGDGMKQTERPIRRRRVFRVQAAGHG